MFKKSYITFIFYSSISSVIASTDLVSDIQSTMTNIKTSVEYAITQAQQKYPDVGNLPLSFVGNLYLNTLQLQTDFRINIEFVSNIPITGGYNLTMAKALLAKKIILIPQISNNFISSWICKTNADTDISLYAGDNGKNSLIGYKSMISDLSDSGYLQSCIYVSNEDINNEWNT